MTAQQLRVLEAVLSNLPDDYLLTSRELATLLGTPEHTLWVERLERTGAPSTWQDEGLVFRAADLLDHYFKPDLGENER